VLGRAQLWRPWGRRRLTLGEGDSGAREGGPAALNRRAPACFVVKASTKTDHSTTLTSVGARTGRGSGRSGGTRRAADR
jgi:hypothetical protein